MGDVLGVIAVIAIIIFCNLVDRQNKRCHFIGSGNNWWIDLGVFVYRMSKM